MRSMPRSTPSHRPTLSSVSIMPGIDTGAPERTDTSSGRRALPKPVPEAASRRRMFLAIRSRNPGASLPPRSK